MLKQEKEKPQIYNLYVGRVESYLFYGTSFFISTPAEVGALPSFLFFQLIYSGMFTTPASIALAIAEVDERKTFLLQHP